MTCRNSTSGVPARCLEHPDGNITIPREALCAALYVLAQVARRLKQLARDPPSKLDAAIIASAEIEIIHLQALLRLDQEAQS